MKIDIDRVMHELQTLATHSSCEQPPPAVTRVVYSNEDLTARQYLRGLYEDAGLSVRVDAVGNTFARWEGTDPAAAVVGTGSHCDAIPHSGMYDGTVGVIGGLEAIRALQAAGFAPTRGIELLMITSEEPTRFGIGCIGSRAIAGAIDAEHLSAMTDDDGRTFDEVCRAAGFTGDISSARLDDSYYHRWVELHIEQATVLEQTQTQIGVVTAIAAPATLRVRVDGVGGHAGGVMMADRRDALCGAAELVCEIERIANDLPSENLVATVGTMRLHPSAINSIPSKVEFSIDLRDIDLDRRNQAARSIHQSAETIADRRQLTIDIETFHADPPAVCDRSIATAIEQSCQAMRVSHRRLISRAYHDSLFIDRIAPIGMIFIPCRGGISHRPEEYASPEDLSAGIEVLARTLQNLSR